MVAYAQRLAADADRAGVRLGEPRFDDDSFADKLALVRERAVPVVSFTFGAPPSRPSTTCTGPDAKSG